MPLFSRSLIVAVALLSQGSAGQVQRACSAPTTASPLAPELADAGRLYRGSLVSGGRALFFFKRVAPTGEEYRIFESRQEGGRWSAPRQVRLGDEHSDLYPTLSGDGQRMVFASYRPLPGVEPTRRNAHLWVAERRGDGWSEPLPLTATNRPGLYHPGVAFLEDGSLRFMLIDQGQRSAQRMMALPNGATFGPATPAPEPARWRSIQSDTVFHGAAMSPDGRLAIIGAGRLDPATRRPAPGDALFSRLVNGEWTPLRPLGAGVNTAADENFFTLTPDGCALVFTRDYTTFHIVSVDAATR